MLLPSATPKPQELMPTATVHPLQESLNVPRPSTEPLPMGLGESTIAGHGYPVEGRRIVVTHNYTSAERLDDGILGPYHVAPMPYLDFPMSAYPVVAATASEDVLCLTLSPGFEAYHRAIGLLSPHSRIYQVDPQVAGGVPEVPLGFPYTDPVSCAIGKLHLPDNPLVVASFPGNYVAEQFAAMGGELVQRSSPSACNDKGRFRAAAERYGYLVAPGRELRKESDLLDVVAQFRDAQKVWVKLAHGAGGDFVRPVKGPVTVGRLLEVVDSFRQSVDAAFEQGAFSPGARAWYWPHDSFAPAHSTMFVEQDLNELGTVVLSGSCVMRVAADGRIDIPAYFGQTTGPLGDFRESCPVQLPPELREYLDGEVRKVGTFAREELGLYGTMGADLIVVQRPDGALRAYFVELNGRPPNSGIALIVAEKLGARYWANLELHTTNPADTMEQVERLLTIDGYNYARGDLERGMVVPTLLKSMFDSEGNLLRSADGSFRVLIASNQSQDHCRAIVEKLGQHGLSTQPLQ